jgi:hypothetical protein
MRRGCSVVCSQRRKARLSWAGKRSRLHCSREREHGRATTGLFFINFSQSLLAKIFNFFSAMLSSKCLPQMLFSNNFSLLIYYI